MQISQTFIFLSKLYFPKKTDWSVLQSKRQWPQRTGKEVPQRSDLSQSAGYKLSFNKWVCSQIPKNKLWQKRRTSNASWLLFIILSTKTSLKPPATEQVLIFFLQWFSELIKILSRHAEEEVFEAHLHHRQKRALPTRLAYLWPQRNSCTCQNYNEQHGAAREGGNKEHIMFQLGNNSF